MVEKSRKPATCRIEFLEREEGDGVPKTAIYIVDRSFNVVEKEAISNKGEFTLPEKSRLENEGHLIAFGPDVEKPEELDKKLLKVYRESQLRDALAEGVLALRRSCWGPWMHIKMAVNGSVKRCYPWPVFTQYLKQEMLTVQHRTLEEILPRSIASPMRTLEWQAAYPLKSLLMKCETVCDGLVEVYRRNCCCTPWIVYDPRLPRLIEELEKIVERIPEIPWPPEPDPGPYAEQMFFKDGSLDELSLNAVKDLAALKNLPSQEIPGYIAARKYLCHCWCCCCCTPPKKVAQGFIKPDGTFDISWIEPLRLMTINCHDEYAYKIKQTIDGNPVTIYNGLCSGQWYRYGDEPVLKSYHPDAQGCRHNEFPGTGAFALLQDIGLTGSYRLKTPDAAEWDRVLTPSDYNDGLAYPAANAAAAVGKYLDRNWGGLLRLRYHFSEAMKGIGAKYYRVSVVKADANGNPTGQRINLNTGSWKYYKMIGTDIHVEKEALGPNPVGTQSHLYKIPYDADRAWHSGQYHALLDTTKFQNGRFLLTLEIYNSAGKLIRPNGSPDPGGSIAGNFTYRRWYQETGPTAEVPFAGLTHLLWWDNRKAVAKIEDFRISGVANTSECQFKSGAATDKFSCGYRAYHLEPMFHHSHKLWWRRGMGSPYASGTLSNPPWNPDNVGIPPAPVHQSGTADLSQMLGSSTAGTKCTFTMNLHVNVKTFNGIGTLDHLDGWDYGSFALEIV